MGNFRTNTWLCSTKQLNINYAHDWKLTLMYTELRSQQAGKASWVLSPANKVWLKVMLSVVSCCFEKIHCRMTYDTGIKGREDCGYPIFVAPAQILSPFWSQCSSLIVVKLPSPLSFSLDFQHFYEMSAQSHLNLVKIPQNDENQNSSIAQFHKNLVARTKGAIC